MPLTPGAGTAKRTASSSGVEEVGPYRLLRLKRGRARVRHSGPVLHARAARAPAAPADSPLPCHPASSRFLIDPIGPGTEALTGVAPRRARSRCSVRWGTASASTSTDRSSSAAESGLRRFLSLAEPLGAPRAVLGFRSQPPTPRRQRSYPTPTSWSSLASSPPSLPSRARRPRVRPGADAPSRRALALGAHSPGRRRWPAATAPATAVSSRSTES